MKKFNEFFYLLVENFPKKVNRLQNWISFSVQFNFGTFQGKLCNCLTGHTTYILFLESVSHTDFLESAKPHFFTNEIWALVLKKTMWKQFAVCAFIKKFLFLWVKSASYIRRTNNLEGSTKHHNVWFSSSNLRYIINASLCKQVVSLRNFKLQVLCIGQTVQVTAHSD